MQYKRRGMSRRHSRKDFRNKSGVHPRNMRTSPMRGGIRL